MKLLALIPLACGLAILAGFLNEHFRGWWRAAWRWARPGCRLFGCRAEGWLSPCLWCGAEEEEWVTGGGLWWALRRRLRFARCEECGKRIGWWRNDPNAIDFCSRECEEDWTPF